MKKSKKLKVIELYYETVNSFNCFTYLRHGFEHGFGLVLKFYVIFGISTQETHMAAYYQEDASEASSASFSSSQCPDRPIKNWTDHFGVLTYKWRHTCESESVDGIN